MGYNEIYNGSRQIRAGPWRGRGEMTGGEEGGGEKKWKRSQREGEEEEEEAGEMIFGRRYWGLKKRKIQDEYNIYYMYKIYKRRRDEV